MLKSELKERIKELEELEESRILLNFLVVLFGVILILTLFEFFVLKKFQMFYFLHQSFLNDCESGLQWYVGLLGAWIGYFKYWNFSAIVWFFILNKGEPEEKSLWFPISIVISFFLVAVTKFVYLQTFAENIW